MLGRAPQATKQVWQQHGGVALMPLTVAHRWPRATVTDLRYGPLCECGNPKTDQALTCTDCAVERRRAPDYWSAAPARVADRRRRTLRSAAPAGTSSCAASHRSGGRSHSRIRGVRPRPRGAQHERRLRDRVDGRDLEPVTGCTRVSPGCANCYIERTPPFRMAGRRFEIVGQESTTGVTLHPDRLEQPLHWRKPRRVFVCSLATSSTTTSRRVPARRVRDDGLPSEHVFQVLTKRPERMRAFMRGAAARQARLDHSTPG
jgi:hypothetical protein